MRRDSFHDHIAAKDDIVQADRNMTGTMPGQMDQFKWANTHVNIFICEINRDRTIDGFRKTVDTEEMFTLLFSETSVGEERSEAATDQCQSCFVIRDRLQIQFVDSDLCLRESVSIARVRRSGQYVRESKEYELGQKAEFPPVAIHPTNLRGMTLCRSRNRSERNIHPSEPDKHMPRNSETLRAECDEFSRRWKFQNWRKLLCSHFLSNPFKSKFEY